MNTAKYLYIVNASADVSAYHSVIVEAAKNGGVFSEDFADIFKLTKTPEGSDATYILDFA